MSLSRYLTAIAVVSFGLVTASADQLKLSAGSYSNGSSGGAYTAQILSGPADNSSYSSLAKLSANTFETYCLEPTEYFSSGATYDYTIAGYAFGGSTEDPSRNIGPGDQLSLGTTWLYSQFAQGLLASSTYDSSTRKASYLLLQRAFWYLEDDYSNYGNASTALTNNVYLSLVASQFGGGTAGLAAAQANAADGSYNVWALNITTGSGNSITQNQSQLYYHVPDFGSTAMLLGAGFMLIAFVRRSSRR